MVGILSKPYDAAEFGEEQRLTNKTLRVSASGPSRAPPYQPAGVHSQIQVLVWPLWGPAAHRRAWQDSCHLHVDGSGLAVGPFAGPVWEKRGVRAETKRDAAPDATSTPEP